MTFVAVIHCQMPSTTIPLAAYSTVPSHFPLGKGVLLGSKSLQIQRISGPGSCCVGPHRLGQAVQYHFSEHLMRYNFFAFILHGLLVYNIPVDHGSLQ